MMIFPNRRFTWWAESKRLLKRPKKWPKSESSIRDNNGAEIFVLEVVTPEKAVVNEDAQIVMAPGMLGEFGVLIGHTPFLTTVKTGVIRYTDTERSRTISICSAEVLPKRFPIR